MKTHQKKHGDGLFTQKLNGQLKVGYGLKSEYDKDANGSAKYAWKSADCSDEEETENEDHVSSDESIDESTDEGMNDDPMDDGLNGDGESEIGKYAWKQNKTCNRHHSPLLPKDIRPNLYCGITSD